MKRGAFGHHRREKVLADALQRRVFAMCRSEHGGAALPIRRRSGRRMWCRCTARCRRAARGPHGGWLVPRRSSRWRGAARVPRGGTLQPGRGPRPGRRAVAAHGAGVVWAGARPPPRVCAGGARDRGARSPGPGHLIGVYASRRQPWRQQSMGAAMRAERPRPEFDRQARHGDRSVALATSGRIKDARDRSARARPQRGLG